VIKRITTAQAVAETNRRSARELARIWTYVPGAASR
jgi:hypothetical protein